LQAVYDYVISMNNRYNVAVLRYQCIAQQGGELVIAIDVQLQHYAWIWPPRFIDYGPAARRLNQQSITVYVEEFVKTERALSVILRRRRKAHLHDPPHADHEIGPVIALVRGVVPEIRLVTRYPPVRLLRRPIMMPRRQLLYKISSCYDKSSFRIWFNGCGECRANV